MSLIFSSRFTEIVPKVLQRGLLQASLTQLEHLESSRLALFYLENVFLLKPGMWKINGSENSPASQTFTSINQQILTGISLIINKHSRSQRTL